jgi:hypothetical protein
MGSFSHIDIKIVVGQNGTAGRRNPDDPFLKIHLIDDLSNDPMQEAVPATWTVMKRCFLDRFRSGIYLFHLSLLQFFLIIVTGDNPGNFQGSEDHASGPPVEMDLPASFEANLTSSTICPMFISKTKSV